MPLVNYKLDKGMSLKSKKAPSFVIRKHGAWARTCIFRDQRPFQYQDGSIYIKTTIVINSMSMICVTRFGLFCLWLGANTDKRCGLPPVRS